MAHAKQRLPLGRHRLTAEPQKHEIERRACSIFSLFHRTESSRRRQRQLGAGAGRGVPVGAVAVGSSNFMSLFTGGCLGRYTALLLSTKGQAPRRLS